jgi:hypothetical protein
MARANRRRWWVGLAAGLGLFGAVLWPQPYANAHSLQQSGPFIGVLHIAPSDEPIAGKPAAIAVDITSNQPDFYIASYQVTAKLHAVNTATASTDSTVTLQSSDTSSSSTGSLTFPQPGTYQLTVQGKPLQRGTGQDFSLTYNVRAIGSGNNTIAGAASQATFDAALTALASFGLLAIAAHHQISRRGRYQGK